MNKIRRFFSLVPALILWLMLSVLVWGFVFTRITDTDPAHKITLFVDAEVTDATALAVRLEEKLGGNIRMVKVHPFNYAMLDGSPLRAADLFIIRADHMETYQDWLLPLPEPLSGMEGEYVSRDISWGLLAYNAEIKSGVAADCINYQPLGEPAADYYLCFGNQSRHIRTQPDAVDNAAADTAAILMNEGSSGNGG